MSKQKLLSRISKYLSEPRNIPLFLCDKGAFNWLSDRSYISLRHRLVMGEKLDLKRPVTFNQKLQWLKLHDHCPDYIRMVDKLSAKDYIARTIGKKYVVPLLGAWDDFESISLNSLPDRFVLKTTHDSGGVAICKSQKKFDASKARAVIEASLHHNYYWFGREWPYKSVKPRIIAEQYMCDDDTLPAEKQELTDYKFFCFNGYVDCVMICFDRASGDTKFYFFDDQWKLKRLNKRGKEAPADFTLPRPECLDEMFEIASQLSRGIPYVRVDLYQSNGQVYFGEMTFFPQSGWDPNLLPETDLYFGNLIDLSLAYDCRTGKGDAP